MAKSQQKIYCLRYEYDGRIRNLYYSSTNEEEAKAMFQSIKERGFLNDVKTSNRLIDEKQKKKIMTFFNGPHDCSVRSLLLVMPELDYEEVRKNFLNCTDKYPYGSVTTRDFNIVLRVMKIFDKFEHGKANGKTIWDFADDRENTYILLLEGHFTIVSDGKVVDFFPINLLDGKVHSYWKLEQH